jgi:hypothetical protein
MSENSPRRWFRFSLRTLFVIVTLFACWLAWQLSIVRMRQSALRQLKALPGVEVTTAAAWGRLFPTAPPVPVARIPMYRTWLGDEAIQEISHFHFVNEAEVQRLANRFPEARVQAGPFPEPCHPGCFPAGTLVVTPLGQRPIEDVCVGDQVTTVRPSGETIALAVQSVFITSNRLWRIETEAGSFFTTETQPLCIAAPFKTVAAGKLRPGDKLLRLHDGELQSAGVLSVTRSDRIEKVFNLVLGNSEAFVAGGFLARSKPPALSQAR